MSSRRFHRKSRHGCAQCKRRHIKCDEGQPYCTNCTRAEISCVYEPKKTPVRVQVASPTGSSVASSIESPAAPTVPQIATQSYNVPGAFDLLDMSLMHHYTVSTSLELFPEANWKEIWQKILPTQAQRQPVLMHGILSLASMDLARTRPNERKMYSTRALAHQQAGTALFRNMLGMIQPEDIQILVLFSMILVILAFAFPHTCDEPPDFDGILDLFSLLRGCKAVWHLDLTTVEATPMAAEIRHKDKDQSLVLYAEVKRRFDTLRASLHDPVDVEAADQLFSLFSEKFLTNPDNSADLGRWPSAVSDAFWMRMHNHEPSAINVLAHFSIIVGRFQHQWWSANWDSMLLHTIDKTLSESEKIAIGWDFRAMVEFANTYKKR